MRDTRGISREAKVGLKLEAAAVFCRLALAILAVVTALVPLAANAADAQPANGSATSQKPKPQKIDRAGEALRWEFSDGREVTLFVDRAPSVSFDLPLQIGESTCHEIPEPAPKCHLALPFMLIRFQARWTKNPDASRQGQTVIETSSNQKLESSYAPTVYQSVVQRTEHPGLGHLEMVCDDYSWLTGSKSAPSDLKLVSWSTELMSVNPETGISENMTVAGTYDLHFTRIAGDRLQLQTTGDWYAVETFYATQMFLFGDIFHVVSAGDKGGICQTSLKPGFSAFQTAAGDYIKSLPENYTPYVSGSDRYYEYSQITGNFIELILGLSEDSVQ